MDREDPKPNTLDYARRMKRPDAVPSPRVALLLCLPAVAACGIDVLIAVTTHSLAPDFLAIGFGFLAVVSQVTSLICCVIAWIIYMEPGSDCWKHWYVKCCLLVTAVPVVLLFCLFVFRPIG